MSKKKSKKKLCKIALIKDLLLPIDAIVPIADALNKEDVVTEDRHKTKKGKMIGYALFYALVDEKV